MKNPFLVTVFLLSILLSCSEDNKENRLQELIDQRKEIDRKIEALKKELVQNENEREVSGIFTPIKIDTIKLKTFKHSIEIQGNVETENNILIPAEKPGWVKKLFVKKGDHVKKGAIVIDVGITRIPDSSRKLGFRLQGDVDFDEVSPKCSYITPVPGGVGPMTIVGLLQNTLLAARKEIVF